MGLANTHVCDEFNEVLPERQAALQEPDGNDVVRQGDGVMIVLERIRIGEGYGEDRHVLVSYEVGEHHRQLR